MTMNYSYIENEIYGYMRKNKVFCYLIWRVLSNSKDVNFYMFKTRNYLKDLTVKYDFSRVIKTVTNDFFDKKFLFEPKSHEGRYVESIEYINFVVTKLNAYNYTDYVTDIYRMLDYLRNDLIKKTCRYRYFDWLKASDSKTCEWVYNYLIKSRVIDKTQYQDNEELHLYIVTGFYLWQSPQDEKDKRYKKLLLARNERKHRTTTQSKGSVRPKKSLKDIQLSAEARTKLTELALNYGVPASEWLNSFIIDEYEKMK
ncbi:hypothetical protein EX217_04440 [Providencia rettgeri]|uniref:hypothetical protein n=1 Tax=Providencia rettgeri TaxID=587 RepID=UPI001C830BB2|nr:hypothetical protein [Providencia rettgeri]MBX6966949.1 hypothetical protein [Providencia rettgeri]MBX6974899.1 hypothetical protein [Providencia rettgeri]MBX6994233.1 hypothetical protein [Providencia rettgeri]MBX6999416.1 hypothetical protein [Providencia rettgeri]MBX7019293.1 hypothetical protein [Providencia rettgeri]